MILPIINYPNEILEKKTEEIKDPKDPEIKELILDMIETLKHAQGLGLAAPQVGKSVRLCVIMMEGKTHILINPEIKFRSLRKELMDEGCLSFPGEFIPVKRHKKVRVKALDRNGKEITIKAEGMLSRALQHEIDHLDGILFIERTSKKNAKK